MHTNTKQVIITFLNRFSLFVFDFDCICFEFNFRDRFPTNWTNVLRIT